MNGKSLRSALIVSLACLSSAASAQNVSLYGLVDLGLTKVTGGPWTMTNYNTSRWGLRGGEDLGGGLRAQFQLESEFKADTGAGDSALFNRQAWVGLSGGWGSLRAGRTKSLYDGLSDAIDPFGNNGLVGDYTTPVWRVDVAKSRISNSLQYSSPKVAGFRLGAQIVLSEVSGAANGSGFSLVYDIENLELIAAFDRPVLAKRGDPKPDAWLVGGSYKLGPVKVSASRNVGDTDLASTGESTGTTVGAEWSVAPGIVKAVYGRLTNNVKGRKTEVFGLGYEYAMSKRTTLYTMVAQERVKDVRGINAGIVHRF